MSITRRKRAIDSPEAWGARYASQRHLYVNFCDKLESRVRELMTTNDIQIVQVQGRAKTAASLVGKLNRKSVECSNPLLDVTDLAGIRVVVYYAEDVDRALNVLQREFVWDETAFEDKSAVLAVDQFGYRSVHIIVRLTEDMRSTKEWLPYAELRAEIQVRTSLQDSWAALSHQVDYKSVEEAPPLVRRSLYRLSALLELAEEQFSQLRLTQLRADQSVRDELARGDLDVDLNLSSLHAYMHISPRVPQIQQRIQDFESKYVRDRGGALLSDSAGAIADDRVAQDRRDLFVTLKHVNMAKVEDFDEFLAMRPSRFERLLSAMLDVETESGLSVEDVLTILVMIDRHVDNNFAMEIYDDVRTAQIMHAISDFHGEGRAGVRP